MAGKGRKPKPTHLKVVAKTFKPSRDEVKNPVKLKELDAGAPPNWLSAKAVKYWADISKELKDARLVSRLDRVTLARYCDILACWIEAAEKVDEEGYVCLTATGYPVQNPWVSIKNKAHENLLKIEVEFGMTPSARSRVQAIDTDQPDMFDEFKDP